MFLVVDIVEVQQIVDRIDFISISTFGNAQDFGDLTGTRQQDIWFRTSATRTIVCWWILAHHNIFDTIHFVTISSTGDATRFWNLTQSKNNLVLDVQIKLEEYFGGGDAGQTLIS